MSTALTLALITLDGCLSLDNGRTLALEHPALLGALREWSGRVLGALEGAGGVRAVDGLGRSAAGVAIRCEELWERWGAASGFG